MKRMLALACLGLLVASAAVAAPWEGLHKLMAKGFSVYMVSDVVAKDGGKLVQHTESMMYAQGRRTRVDLDLSKMSTGDKKKKDSQGMPPGMARMYTLTDLDKNVTDMVYPDSKLYMEMDLNKPNKQDKSPKQNWFQNPDLTLEEVGAETVDGHPCRKVKATWKETVKDEERESSAFMWLAKDLSEFPVKIQPIDEKDDNVTTLTYKDIKIGHVDDSLLTVPADYKKGGFMDLMKASFKSGRPKQADDSGDQGEKADNKKSDQDSTKSEGLGSKLKKKLPFGK